MIKKLIINKSLNRNLILFTNKDMIRSKRAIKSSCLDNGIRGMLHVLSIKETVTWAFGTFEMNEE